MVHNRLKNKFIKYVLDIKTRCVDCWMRGYWNNAVEGMRGWKNEVNEPDVAFGEVMGENVDLGVRSLWYRRVVCIVNGFLFAYLFSI